MSILLAFSFVSYAVQDSLTTNVLLPAQHQATVKFGGLRGHIIPHANDMLHLITGHPTGLIAEYNFKKNLNSEWQRAFNFPDYGITAVTQWYQNDILGDAYGAMAHIKFYLFRSNFNVKLAQGLGYATNPFHITENTKNNVFGTRIMGAFEVALEYNKTNLYKNFGFSSGLSIIHFSNGRTRSPNKGINGLFAEVALNYSFESKINKTKVLSPKVERYLPDSVEKVRFVSIFRGGINENIYLNQGQHPFYHIGLYAQKRTSRFTTWQLGLDGFWSYMRRQQIQYVSSAFPDVNQNVDADTDFRRIGIVIGHNTHINKLVLVKHLGTYLYRPFNDDNKWLYQRIGLQYDFTKQFFTVVTLKTHFAKAEAVEYGFGLRW
ncbi:MAG: acyloxyacyl hydrolase [Luteibaculaceae bacterium]